MAKKTIEQLNALMTTEFARLGPLAWIRTDDKRLFMPAIEEELKPTGEMGPVWRPEQTPTGLWVVKPVVEPVPLMPKFQGGETFPPIWCLCHTQHVDPDIWKQSFGSLEDYIPRQWVPTYTDKHQTIPMHLTSEPEEADAWAAIYFLRSTVEPVVGEFSYQYRRAAERLRKKSIEDNTYKIRHMVGAMGTTEHKTGARGGAASYPGQPN